MIPAWQLSREGRLATPERSQSGSSFGFRASFGFLISDFGFVIADFWIRISDLS